MLQNEAPDNFRVARHKAAYKKIFFNQRLRDQINKGNPLVRAIAQKVQGKPLLEELYRATLDLGANRAYEKHIDSMKTRANDTISQSSWFTEPLISTQIDLCKNLANAGYPEYAYQSAHAYPPSGTAPTSPVVGELVNIAAFYGHGEAYSFLHKFNSYASTEEYAVQTRKGYICAAAMGDAMSNARLGTENIQRFKNTVRTGNACKNAYLLSLWHTSRATTCPDDYLFITPIAHVKLLLKSDMNTKELRARYPKIFKEAKQALKLAR